MRLQPFICAGIRYNILKNYRYISKNTYADIDDYIVPNIKKGYLNYTYGVGACYKLKRIKSGITLEIELNNDNQLGKLENQKYFTHWKYGKASNKSKSEERFYGGKFQSLLINLGYRHYF